MKIKKVTLLLLMVLIFSGCSPECDEAPVCSSALKSEAKEGDNRVGVETGKAARSIENAPKMEGNFIKCRTNIEEEATVQAPE
ncbi:MAG: hypothetical protein K2J04_11620, partial [Lachnospiraceae bacterium]|nr:hypothetical protein [Lachnospiraceae bacterium]